MRHAARIEAEARHVVDRGADPQFLEDADRHQVARAHQRFAQARRPAELAGGVLGPPGFFAAVAVEDDRRILQHGRRREAVVERRRVQERLESGTGQAPRLGDAVVLVGEVVEAAHQRDDAAVVGIERHQRALRFRDLPELRMPGFIGDDVDDVAALEHLAGILGRRPERFVALLPARP